MQTRRAAAECCAQPALPGEISAAQASPWCRARPQQFRRGAKRVSPDQMISSGRAKAAYKRTTVPAAERADTEQASVDGDDREVVLDVVSSRAEEKRETQCDGR